jgi:hypothetical protein
MSDAVRPVVDNWDDIRFHPASALKHLLANMKISYLELERRIESLCDKSPMSKIDRRKLKDLVQLVDDGLDREKDVALSLRQLMALDAFLSQHGEGLGDKPIFERPALLRSIAECGRVTITLGAYPHDPEKRNELNLWDVRAMTELFRAMEKLKPGLDVEFQDLRFGRELPCRPPFLDDAGPSVICLGSPRACYAAELMLADMLKLKAFTNESEPGSPLRFIWSPKASRPHPSAFRGEAKDIAGLDKKLAKDIAADRTWGAIQIADKLFPVHGSPKGAELTTSHGIVITQRRPSGRIWAVIAGASGPATHACAKAVEENLTEPSPEGKRNDTRARWNIVECTIQQDANLLGDPRRVISHRVVEHGMF